MGDERVFKRIFRGEFCDVQCPNYRMTGSAACAWFNRALTYDVLHALWVRCVECSNHDHAGQGGMR